MARALISPFSCYSQRPAEPLMNARANANVAPAARSWTSPSLQAWEGGRGLAVHHGDFLNRHLGGCTGNELTGALGNVSLPSSSFNIFPLFSGA